MRSGPTVLEMLLCLGTAGLAACFDEPVRVEPAPRVLSADIIPVAQPLARSLRVELDRPAAVEVIYGAEDGSPLRVVSDEVEAVHDIFLPRLRANRIHTFEARPGPEGGSVRGSFRTDPLPELLAALSFQWYHEVTGGVVGSVQRANGNFALIYRGSGVREYTPAGELVAALPNTDTRKAHHDLVEHQERLLILTDDPRPWNDTLVVGDAVWAWNTETGLVEPVWSSWDQMDRRSTGANIPARASTSWTRW